MENEYISVRIENEFANSEYNLKCNKSQVSLLKWLIDENLLDESYIVVFYDPIFKYDYDVEKEGL